MTGSQPPPGPPGGAYDRFAYPGYAYPSTHPAHLEVVARLFGLAPAPAAGCRVLELGCGDGGNLLSMAQTLPGATLVGVDAAAAAVQRGQALAEAAGLSNVTLTAGDISALPAELGSFDYIVAHGVYSWIPPRVRGALLSACRTHLASQGVAFVSYNAYPGSYLRDMARDILAYHVRGLTDPAERLASAQTLMRAIVDIEEPTPFARILREQMQRTLGFSDALLVHDDLAEISTPFYFHEFMEHAEAHGLGFLSEANVSDSQMHGVPDSAAALMAGLPDDAVVREQYLDFFRNRMFRQTLLCHGEAAVRRALDDALVADCSLSSSAKRDEAQEPPEPIAGLPSMRFVAARGVTMTTSEPEVIAAMQMLGEAWPGAVSFGALLERAGTGAQPAPSDLADRLRARMLEAYVAGVVELRSVAPPLPAGVPTPSERPRASPLARAQAAAGARVVSTLAHSSAALDGELDGPLLALLDGTRDTEALARELARTPGEVTDALASLAGRGLLCAPA